MNDQRTMFSSAGRTPSTLAAFPTVNAAYASVEAALTAINAGGVCAYAVQPPLDGSRRVRLHAVLRGTENQTAKERVYVAEQFVLNGTPGVRLKQVCSITWTAGAEVGNALGGVTGDRWSKTAALSDTGPMFALTQYEFEADAAGAVRDVHHYDLGPVDALIRVFAIDGGGVTHITPMEGPWR